MKHITVAVVAILALSSVHSIASADVKNYLASSCEVDTGYASYSDSYRYSRPFGYLENTSTTKWLHVTCPMVRDDTTNNNIATSGWIRVRDWNMTEDISCSLYRVYASGTTASGNVKSSAGFMSAVQKLSFRDLNEGLYTDSMHIQCRIPPAENGHRSGIYSYSINEL